MLVDGERQITGVATAGAVTVVSLTDPTTPGEVAVVEPTGLRVLTSLGGGFAAEVTARPMAEINATAPDGYPVHGWVVRPAVRGRTRYVLMIHGGPFSQYGWALFDEAQVYAGAGYAVVMGNPRGSSGYGQAHARAVVGDVGRVSATDLLALLDTALEADPSLDRHRWG